MKWPLKFIIIFIIFPLNYLFLNAQKEYVLQLDIIEKCNDLIQEDKFNEASFLLRSNKDFFQYDELSKFWYDYMYGIILYGQANYESAFPFLKNAVFFLDSCLEKGIYKTEIQSFIPIYYYIIEIESHLNLDSNIIIKDLNRAKFVFERYDLRDLPEYHLILSSIEAYGLRFKGFKGFQYYGSRDYTNAILFLSEFIDFIRDKKLNDILDLIESQRILALSYLAIGDYSNAEKWFLYTLTLLEEHNLTDELVYRRVLDSTSILYLYLQNYRKAHYFHEQAKLLFEKNLDFGDDYVTCLNNGAIIQNSSGYNTVAKMMIDVALHQAEVNLSDTSSFKPNSQFYGEKLKLKQFNEYDKNRIKNYLIILTNSSKIYSDLGYFSEAIKTAKKAIAIAQKNGLESSIQYGNLGNLYLHKSKFQQAVMWYQKGYNLCKTPVEYDELGMNLALAMFLSKDTKVIDISKQVSIRIRDNIREMFSFMSGEERGVYWQHFKNYLPFLNIIIYEKGKAEDFGVIYDNILESKGLLLRSTNAIREAILDGSSEADKVDYSRIIFLKQALQTEMNDSLRNSYLKEVENLDKRLSRNVNSYADLKSNTSRWEEIKDALNRDEIAIEFFNLPIISGHDSIQDIEGKPRVCAITLRKGYNSPHIIPLCPEEQLLSLSPNKIYSSEDLYNLIWRPLKEEFRGIKNIYFAADRELHKIAIEYAQMPDESVIGDHYNLYRLSSTRVLAESKASRKVEKVVLYGGLVYDMEADELIAESRNCKFHSNSGIKAFLADNMRGGFKYLPGTLEEVEKISQNFTEGVKMITGKPGTEESFKALAGSPVDIIHLATHGFFWTDEDAKKNKELSFLKLKNDRTSSEDWALLRSGLIFSGANISLKGDPIPVDIEDGILTALELSNMNLGKVDLVVLSACESGLGETSGEGVFGLQRGFKLAGANSLLMSLWKVDDDATQMLMTEFYSNLMSGQSKQQSLLNAQKALRENPRYYNPRYWAGFILLDGLN